MGKVTINYESNAYQEDFLSLSKGDQRIALKLFEIMEDGLNTFQSSGDSRKFLATQLGITEQAVKNALVRLKDALVIEPTALAGEYIVDPCIAVKGWEGDVWKNYQKIERELMEKKKDGE